MRRAVSLLLPIAIAALLTSGAMAERGSGGEAAHSAPAPETHAPASHAGPSPAESHTVPSAARTSGQSSHTRAEHPENSVRPVVQGHFRGSPPKNGNGNEGAGNNGGHSGKRGHDGDRHHGDQDQGGGQNQGSGGGGDSGGGDQVFSLGPAPDLMNGFTLGPLFENDDDDSSAAPQQNVSPDVADQDAGPESGEPEEAGGAVRPDLFRPAYDPTDVEPAIAYPIPSQPATTLVFSNGKPNMTVRNYALTPTTLYVFDGGARIQIPLSEINLPATVQANRSAGVDFSLPGGA
ncbi:MAG TPA: hypothetical protein VHX11_03835 [Acidobacteriaceae bacterium]|nr:hypothetical protein [Acidobacteriaceae bacterium]